MQIPALDYQKFAKISGGALAFGIIYGFLLFPNILHFAIKYMVQLRPGSRTREQLYLPIPFDIEFTISVWNITNPEEVQNGAVPIVKEVGPYYFLERKLKYDVEDDDEADTLSFDQKNTFYFQANKTLPLTGKEIVTIPHLVIQMGLLMIQRDQAPLLPLAVKGLNELFENPTSPYFTEKVEDLLFYGVPINCDVDGFEAKSVCSALEDTMGESAVLNDTHLGISLFKSQNGTSTGRFTVYRGMKNISDTGRMVAFNGETENDVFNGDECNELRGTDALFFPPFLKRDDTIWAFSAQSCRSFGFRYKEDSSYKGVALKRFSINFNKDDPDCFCRDPDECPPEGVIDMSMCLQAPLLASKPHFLHADPILREKVHGFTPNEELHEFLVDFDLFAGAALNARVAIQFNLDMTAVEEFEPMANLPSVYMPIFWITEAIALNKTFVYQFKALHFGQHLNSFIKYVVVTLGLLGTGGFTFLAFNSGETPVDEQVIVEREAPQSSKMYPDEAEVEKGTLDSMMDFKDKIAAKFGFSDDEKNS
ncbi:sensory neuron membrane protein 1-like [Culicoides brevitarsis]|uniref:sensory neuron membrane protein 1-like n=1 Tax=Culicoides brevitarsis TaxID=469753 RepID=UPI00307C06B8